VFLYQKFDPSVGYSYIINSLQGLNTVVCLQFVLTKSIRLLCCFSNDGLHSKCHSLYFWLPERAFCICSWLGLINVCNVHLHIPSSNSIIFCCKGRTIRKVTGGGGGGGGGAFPTCTIIFFKFFACVDNFFFNNPFLIIPIFHSYVSSF
jgi:hypothetical protein